MKSRLIWAAVLFAALAGFYFTTIRPTQTPSPGFSRKRLERLRTAPLPDIPPPPLPEPRVSLPVITPPPLTQTFVMPPLKPRREERQPLKMEVPIQDNSTIDFSIGAPVVRSDGKDKEALEKALKEMAEATKDVSFPPTKK